MIETQASDQAKPLEKNWDAARAALQQSILQEHGGIDVVGAATQIGPDGKPCRACTDFSSWRRSMAKTSSRPDRFKVAAAAAEADDAAAEVEYYRKCPPDSSELGNATWTFLHTTAAYYPEQPKPEEKDQMRQFLGLFSKIYPCSYCAQHLQKEMKTDPPILDNRSTFSKWLCRIHNEVNERLGKPIFDCGRVDERWHDGPPDMNC